MEHLWSDRERQWLSLLRQCRSGCVVGEELREPSPDVSAETGAQSARGRASPCGTSVCRGVSVTETVERREGSAGRVGATRSTR
jgi:hypothetical protein